MTAARMRRHIVIVGAGMGGLAAAIDLARRGASVTVVEQAAAPGGKMRRVEVDGAGIDGGPTVFTMRWVFDGLLRDAGVRLEDLLQLMPAEILARHAWRDGSRLDLHADIDRSADAIAAFAGAAEADGYRRFCARSRDIYRTLLGPFIDAQRTSPFELSRRVGFGNIAAVRAMRPWQRMWPALGQYFRDPRLQQLFGRYATYCGSSPFSAPATLMLVAHVEQDGVWLVRGGMHEVALALAQVAAKHGAELRYGCEVRELLVSGGNCTGVLLDDGRRIDADAVVFNGDSGALASGLLGASAIGAAPAVRRESRSLSAITWCLRTATRGFPLVRHNVFFAEDYRQEFKAIFAERRVTEAPTVYVCAQDRGDDGGAIDGSERLLVLVNAPADGDRGAIAAAEFSDIEQRVFALMAACGLEVDRDTAAVVTDPSRFDDLFPGAGGAIYGRATHGAFATFARPGARSRMPGLYLAGGSVHPGPGVPMAALSGRRAAESVAADLQL
ncbi:MAG: phytoene desaturase family protein [Pseudomonadota bacterium]